jgi:two-component system response regulator HydG
MRATSSLPVPFVAVNCGALTSTLLESELFGILSDVASGVKARPGRFVEADGGTLFLDEIGEMPVQQQVALLRVLSTGTVTPVGGGPAIAVNVRVIAATNRDLMQDIEDGRFRQDLWYRLNVIPVEIPPLRERRADIPALAQHFVAVFANQQGREIPALSPALMSVLMQSGWPGNVRELQNYIERLMAMTPGKVLRPDPLPHDLQKRARSIGRLDRGRTLREMVAELERRQLQEALERHGGNQTQAARELGLTEQSFRYRLRRYALPPKRHFQRIR